METLILNKTWKVKDLQFWASTKEVKGLINDYLNNPNCSPYDWVKGEQISDLAKASFIYSIVK